MAGTSNSKGNSYLCRLCTYQHLPDHCVPSLLEVMVNQSESEALLIWMYLIRACSSCQRVLSGLSLQASGAVACSKTQRESMQFKELLQSACTSLSRFSQPSLSLGPALHYKAGRLSQILP